MDNSELALSLRESHLEKIATYLSRCGLQSNSELIAKGYTDVGWDPVEGERYLDFLRFCVWVNGESVEENANLVVRLLIRKPECLGPALRGDGQGLLRAMQGAIALSESTAANVDPAMKEDEDYIDMGEAILNFYSVLVDLLGRCSPDAQQLVGARSDSVRARAILQSLIPLSDLEGVLSMRFFIPNFSVLESMMSFLTCDKFFHSNVGASFSSSSRRHPGSPAGPTSKPQTGCSSLPGTRVWRGGSRSIFPSVGGNFLAGLARCNHDGGRKC